MIKEETVNNIKITPVKVPIIEKTEIKGAQLFDIFPYNLFIASKKKSGKTSLISNIIQKTTDKDTIFYLFVSTHAIDPSWKTIIETLDKRGCEVNVYDSISEGKHNYLDEVINKLNNDDDNQKIKGKGKQTPTILPQSSMKIYRGGGPVEVIEEEPEKKKKKKTPKYLFIFDDISNQLKNTAVSRFLKIHRHFGASCIISSQYVKDLQPQAITQIDYFITFKNFSEEKLMHIWKLLDLSIDFEKYLQLYHYATKEPFSFLYTNVRTEEFRKSFSTVLKISE